MDHEYEFVKIVDLTAEEYLSLISQNAEVVREDRYVSYLQRCINCGVWHTVYALPIECFVDDD